jgi:hypothetical protein
MCRPDELGPASTSSERRAPLATAEKAVEFALKHKGYTENPPGSNRTKFGEAYGMNGVPWCMEFVWYVLFKLGVPILKTAYTPTAAQWFKDQQRGFTNEAEIQRGDVLFFDFPDSTHRIQHVGFATDPLKAGRVPTIEGNTSAGSSGSQDNGGGVFTRDRGQLEIVYIGRPAYDDVDELPRFDLPKQRTFLRLGDEGADVKTLQKDLNAWMRALRKVKGDHLEFDFGSIDADGEFGSETKKALQTFQMQHERLEPDGLFGRETERVLEKVQDKLEARLAA